MSSEERAGVDFLAHMGRGLWQWRSLLDGRFRQLERDVFTVSPAASIEQALLCLALDAGVRAELPVVIEEAAARYLSMASGDALERECALLELYTALHGAGRAYSPEELKRLDKARGIACHPGGLAPLLLAEALIGPETVVFDLGAGNGLQGLLLQCMRPHRKTVQVELSSEMVRVGRVFQKALGIEEGRVEWFNGDILSAPLEEADFIYIYRPARPVGPGREFYKGLAGRLIEEAEEGLVVLSVADCLGRFLGAGFAVVFENEHMSVFLKGRRSY